METKFLFPYSFKKFGWIILIPSALIGLITFIADYQFSFLHVNVFAFYDSSKIFGPSTFFNTVENNITDELFGILTIIGALFIACSKEKIEDEFIAKIRLNSLLWATYINYFLLITAMVVLYGSSFYMVLVLNMFTLLIIFLIRFYYLLYKR